MSIKEAEARVAAEQLLGSEPEEIVQLRFTAGGGESDCFRLRLSGEDLFMKMNHRPGEPLGIYFHARLHKSGLPVPELIAWHAKVGPRATACGIWEFVDGVESSFDNTPGSCPYDEAQNGDLLRQIHALTYVGPYCFPGDDSPADHFGPCSETWLDMFPCVETAASYFDQGLMDKNEADILASLPETMAAELSDVPKRLLHMDFIGNGNFIIEPGSRRIVAIVDGAESMVGDPRLELSLYDYAFAEGNAGLVHNNSEGFNIERFRESYGVTHDPDDQIGRFYVLMVLLFERFFYSYVAGQRGKYHLDEIRSRLHTFY